MNTTPKPIKVPDVWRIAQPGEFFSSTLPLHRLEAIRDALAPEGLRYEFTPSPRGYFVHRLADA
jgi:hypothetical protein